MSSKKAYTLGSASSKEVNTSGCAPQKEAMFTKKAASFRLPACFPIPTHHPVASTDTDARGHMRVTRQESRDSPIAGEVVLERQSELQTPSLAAAAAVGLCLALLAYVLGHVEPSRAVGRPGHPLL